MTELKITAGPFSFDACLEIEAAPKTCAAFSKHLPFRSQVVHVRWSGEGVWIPLGDLDFGVSYENHTSYPAPGQIILYPGGISETEILLAYGGVRFASRAGRAGLRQRPSRGEILLRRVRHHQRVGFRRGTHSVERRVRDIEQQAPRLPGVNDATAKKVSRRPRNRDQRGGDQPAG